MLQHLATVLWNKKAGPGYYRIGLRCPGNFSAAVPGQFVMLRLVRRLDPVLRRPFSIHNLVMHGGQANGIELLYQVVGKATTLLSQLKTGDRVDILGPLGRGFQLPSGAKKVYLAAGGVGVAPLVFMVSYFRRRPVDLSQWHIFLGAKSREDLLSLDVFSTLNIPLHITTDDGSAGEHCLVTHPLETTVEQSPPDLICACGPPAMLGCVADIAERHGIACQVSIEAVMACGMGACLGCAVARRGEPQTYLHVCMDGPVFDSRQLKW